MEIPDHSHGKAQNRKVGQDVEGSGNDVGQNLVSAGASRDCLIPVECKRPAKEEGAKNHACSPKADQNHKNLCNEFEGRHVEDSDIEDEDGHLNKDQRSGPKNLNGDQILERCHQCGWRRLVEY